MSDVSKPAIGLAAAFFGHMRDMRPKYTGPLANLRYGNELAQRQIDFIKAGAPEISHRRLLFTEAQRLHREAQKVSKTRVWSPMGERIDTDYAEQLRQAALAVRLIAMKTD